MKKLALAAILAVSTMGVSMADVDSEKVIDYRQAAFKVAGWNMGILGGMLKGEIEYNPEEAVAAAKRINEMAKAVGATFVDGTYEGSNASPKIVEERADFDKKLAAFIQESDVMVEAAGEKKTLAAQMGKLGGTCKSCHDSYKVD
ncbi:cytochrome c [Ignatzschineria indica]|uniref:c-type cytochrome n=1 Tax=Ignatzschineria indica TaxID=472583 RepID=UPI0025780A72|nr:cytochrome c [Ignatzschineria indica]MDM1544942.1 cytochrome c [Ignatzschineria indica]